jgi:bifunctional DNA-binding transcriptional regulator/antitoxin component of YhaV-PrlF toxin-antitoxin module
MNDKTTILTERGQVSVPASIRREVGLKPGASLRWERLSDTELRVVVDRPAAPQGAYAALGYARRWVPAGSAGRTAEVMKESREGEND